MDRRAREKGRHPGLDVLAWPGGACGPLRPRVVDVLGGSTVSYPPAIPPAAGAGEVTTGCRPQGSGGGGVLPRWTGPGGDQIPLVLRCPEKWAGYPGPQKY